MIARCDTCDSRARRLRPDTENFSGHRYDPKQAPLERCRCGWCGGPLRAKRKGESEACITHAVVLPEQLMASHAYRRGVIYGTSHPTGTPYVPTCMRDWQQKAEYLEGVAEGRRQRTASPKRRAGDVARERKKTMTARRDG